MEPEALAHDVEMEQDAENPGTLPPELPPDASSTTATPKKQTTKKNKPTTVSLTLCKMNRSWICFINIYVVSSALDDLLVITIHSSAEKTPREVTRLRVAFTVSTDSAFAGGP